MLISNSYIKLQLGQIQSGDYLSKKETSRHANDFTSPILHTFGMVHSAGLLLQFPLHLLTAFGLISRNKFQTFLIKPWGVPRRGERCLLAVTLVTEAHIQF